jgi:transcription initiation factor TFIIIB Brf1 subunit/transcription initiation factor TFIIB
MAELLANLSKPERTEKAAAACAADHRSTARKAGKNYQVAHMTIIRRLKQLTRSKKLSNQ